MADREVTIALNARLGSDDGFKRLNAESAKLATIGTKSMESMRKSLEQVDERLRAAGEAATKSGSRGDDAFRKMTQSINQALQSVAALHRTMDGLAQAQEKVAAAAKKKADAAKAQAATEKDQSRWGAWQQVSPVAQRQAGAAASGTNIGQVAQLGLIMSTLRDLAKVTHDFADVGELFAAAWKGKRPADAIDRMSGQGVVGSMLRSFHEGAGRFVNQIFEGPGNNFDRNILGGSGHRFDNPSRLLAEQERGMKLKADAIIRQEEFMQQRIQFRDPFEQQQRAMQDLADDQQRQAKAARRWMADDDRGGILKAMSDRADEVEARLRKAAPSLSRTAAGDAAFRAMRQDQIDLGKQHYQTMRGPLEAAYVAQDKLEDAKERQKKAEQDIIAWQQKSNSTASEGLHLQNRLQEATQKRLQAEQQHAQAVRSVQAGNLTYLEKLRDAYARQEEVFKQMAVAEKSKLEGIAEHYGSMDPFQRLAAKSTLQRARQFGVESLIPEEMQLFRQLAPDVAAEHFRKIAEADNLFEELRGVGQRRKEDEFERASKQAGDMKASVEANMKVQIQIDDSVRQKMLNDVVAPILDAIERDKRLIDDLQLKVNQALNARNVLNRTP